MLELSGVTKVYGAGAAAVHADVVDRAGVAVVAGGGVRGVDAARRGVACFHAVAGIAVITDDGFVIALVYGNDTQWLKNVLAAGRAEVVHDSVTYVVERPEVVPVERVVDYFKPSDRRLFGLFGVDSCLRLYHAEHD